MCIKENYVFLYPQNQENMPRKKSKLDKVIDEISYDLDIPKSRVSKILKLTFKEIAYILLFRKRAIMIRGFVKFVVAVRAAGKVRSELKKKLAKKTKTKLK